MAKGCSRVEGQVCGHSDAQSDIQLGQPANVCSLTGPRTERTAVSLHQPPSEEAAPTAVPSPGTAPDRQRPRLLTGSSPVPCETGHTNPRIPAASSLPPKVRSVSGGNARPALATKSGLCLRCRVGQLLSLTGPGPRHTPQLCHTARESLLTGHEP